MAMRAGLGGIGATSIEEMNLRAQTMGCVHTLMRCACATATLHALHSATTSDDISIEAEDIRNGVIYETLSPDGVGGQLMAMLAPAMAGDVCADGAVLDTIDESLKVMLSENVAYATAMIASNRFQEYQHTLSRVVISDCDLVAIGRGATVDDAIAIAQQAADDDDDAPMSGDDSTSGDKSTSGDDDSDDSPCKCDMCTEWPTLRCQFERWDPPPGIASVCASAIKMI